MICITYESYNGGTNNVAVAIDWETGISATSTKGADAARRNLLHKIKKYKPA